MGTVMGSALDQSWYLSWNQSWVILGLILDLSLISSGSVLGSVLKSDLGHSVVQFFMLTHVLLLNFSPCSSGPAGPECVLVSHSRKQSQPPAGLLDSISNIFGYVSSGTSGCWFGILNSNLFLNSSSAGVDPPTPSARHQNPPRRRQGFVQRSECRPQPCIPL